MNPNIYLLVTKLALYLSCKKDKQHQSMGKSCSPVINPAGMILKAVELTTTRE
jgi:hypothetical protein